MEDNLVVSDIEQESKKMILGYVGGTKGGKTTGIASLTSIPDQIIKVSSGDSGRTKTTVEYHFTSWSKSKSIIIENIDIFEQNILGANNGDVKKYNEQLKNNSVLTNVLGLHSIEEGENVHQYILNTINLLQNTTVNLESIKKLLCTEGIDKYIRRITLAVPAQEDIKTYINSNNIELYIRDTRGLLDIALEDNAQNKRQSISNLKDLGLEGLDGIVFFCSETYPNIIQDLYYDTFKSVFQSVPVFLMARDNMLFKIFSINNQVTNYQNVDNFIDSIQKRTNILYTEIEEQYFLNTFDLMQRFEITVYDEVTKQYSFKDTYFNQEMVEFIVPSCASLKKLSVDKDFNPEECIKEDDFVFYQTISVVSCIKMITMIKHLQTGMIKILKSGLASNLIWKKSNDPVSIKSLQEDYSKYDNYHTSYAASKFVKPQFTTLMKKDIEEGIGDSSVELLGKRGGITTMNNGKLRYPITAVTAVTARQWISHLIDKIEITGNLIEKTTNKELFPDLHDDVKAQNALVQKALYCALYKYYTDVDATIQSYLIVERYKVVKEIGNIRDKGITANSISFIDVIRNIIKDYCIRITEIQDISSTYKNQGENGVIRN